MTFKRGLVLFIGGGYFAYYIPAEGGDLVNNRLVFQLTIGAVLRLDFVSQEEKRIILFQMEL